MKQARRESPIARHARPTWLGYRSAILVAAGLCVAVAPCACAADPAIAEVPWAPALGVGVGRTFDTWNTSGEFVLPLTALWDAGRYELGVFHLMSAQRDIPWPDVTRVLAEPYWAITAMRRWTLVQRSGWSAFVGFGGVYKTTEDFVSASHWDFTESLGARVALPRRPVTLEFAVRHWSNAGIRRPNYGQNLATLNIIWNPFVRAAVD